MPQVKLTPTAKKYLDLFVTAHDSPESPVERQGVVSAAVIQYVTEHADPKLLRAIREQVKQAGLNGSA